MTATHEPTRRPGADLPTDASPASQAEPSVSVDPGRALLSGVTGHRHEVVILTDEELVALDEVQTTPQISPTPWLDHQHLNEDDLRMVALRSLLVRKLARPATERHGADVSWDDIELTAEVRGVLALRRTASVILRAQRQEGTDTSWTCCYSHTSRGVLVEEVDQQGLHTFALTTPAGAAEFVRSLANPHGAPGHVTQPQAFTSVAFQSLDAEPAPFAGAHAATTLSVSAPGAPHLDVAVVYAGSECLGLLIPDPRADAFMAQGILDGDLAAMLVRALSADGRLSDAIRSTPVNPD